MQAARETMQTSISPAAGPLVGSLDQRQVAGSWMLGATALLIMGAFIPQLIVIFDEIMGFPLEVGIGIFGIERCTVGGCESIPLGGLGVGSSSMVLKVVVAAWRAAAVAAIVASGMAGIVALKGKRVRSSWVEVPVGIFLCFLLLLVVHFEISLFYHIAEQVVSEGADAGDRRWAMPGISFVLLLVGSGLALWVHTKRLDARGPAPRIESTGTRGTM